MAGLPHRTGLVSDVCSSAPRFASGFLPTPHRCDAVAFGYRFRSLRPEEDLHLQVHCHAWHTMGPGLRRDDGEVPAYSLAPWCTLRTVANSVADLTSDNCAQSHMWGMVRV